ncbi:MAG: single-stranded DNA-binding protein [Bacteroidales bacterium]|nr:single-stranded DNA-binding protein [Bacteroidales bacterium]
MGLSRGVNKVILIGNVGKDPEVKHLDNGMVITKFSLATSETYTKNNEKVTNTEWHNIVLFKGQAEVAEKYVKKGDALYIEGKIQTRSWDDQDGNKRYMTEIVGNNMQMLGGGSGRKNDQPAQQASQESAQPQAQQSESLGEEDDLPF